MHVQTALMAELDRLEDAARRALNLQVQQFDRSL